MNTIASTMAEHHVRCDALFAGAEADAEQSRWEQAVLQFTRFREELERHFQAEETVLFPAFELATGILTGPTTVMRQEHERMRALLDQVDLSLSAHDADRLDGYSSTLLILMRQHNVKEETVLYPMCDRALGDRALEVIHRLNLESD